MRLLRLALALPLVNRIFKNKLKGEEKLTRTVAGLRFPNPIGMAAGFDKNAVYLDELEALGFGFIEIGTVTPKPQEGNPRPRLFRLPEDKALINRMGFNNDGADVIAGRLSQLRKHRAVVGGNIGKNKVTPNEEAVRDYLYCFDTLFHHVDYFVLNVSSPNTPGLRELQNKDELKLLLSEVQQRNSQYQNPKPVFLKIAPDLTDAQLDDIIEIVKVTGISGIIAVNTTLSREGLKTPKEKVESAGAGGLSGLPLKERAYEVLIYLRKRLPKPFAIMSSGGIMSADEALRRLQAGADLIQIYTGFIYEGPQIIAEIKEKMIL